MPVFLSTMLRIFSSSIWYKVRISIIYIVEHPTTHDLLHRTQKYIEALTSKTKPTLILVCMIYYPDENNTPSWANASLGALGYNQNPAKIQLLIRKFYEEATRYEIDK